MLDELGSLEFYSDPSAWGVGTIVWLIFMYLMWGMNLLVSKYSGGFIKILISVLGLPICYIVAKIMIERGR